MKIIRVTAVLAILLSLCFAGIYLKFFSTINSHIDAYIVQVGIYIIITGVFLTEEEAKNMGNDISANGITCVIKQEKFTSDFKEKIEQQDYEAIIKELGS